ncbi:MAG TPA: TM0106 family RecB-like putative nuclease, partial [Acidimicrobiales bacterium]
TKLARRVKAAAILQLCSYSEQVARVQGTAPDFIHVLGGDEISRAYGLSDYAAYYRAVKASFEEAVEGPPLPTYPEPVPHCGLCRWAEVCEGRRRQDDHLSLVAGMRRGQARRLVAAGLPTLTTLASSPETAVPGVGTRALERLRGQARLQLDQRRTGEVRYELTQPVEAGLGLAALPSPTPADLFFDMEGDPFAGDDGLEYLFGVVEVAGGQPRYRAFWAHDRSEEREAFERFVDLVMARLDDHPDLHVYHYGSYEPAAVRRLMGTHATREHAVDRLLRGAVFVDLHQVVRQGVVVSQESYSIKKLEPLYMAARDGAITDAGSSIVAYERWLETAEQTRLDEIAEYNRADCESTRLLRDWLEGRRADAERHHGEPLPRPQPSSGEPGAEQAAAEAETEALVARLAGGIADEPDLRAPPEAATWLLAQLLDWHRREDKPEWWAHFSRLGLSDEELVDDPESIGELEYAGVVGGVGRSLVHRYRFRSGQEHKVSVGDSVLDPRSGARCGSVHAIDDAEGVLDLRRGRGSCAPHPTSVIPDTPRPTTVLRQALARVGGLVADHGIDGPGRYRAVRDLLMRRPPWLGELPLGQPLQGADERPLDAARRLTRQLDGTCLAIQGPPGSGKTFTAAHMIVDLVRSGRRVGITATTHKAITNLVDAACSCAREAGRRLSVVQKGEEDRASTSPMVEVVGDNQLVAARLAGQQAQVVAGTPWLFARPELAGAVDVLFVDEAGQMSLANVVAAGVGADSIVLLGDPQQLAQPSKGAHPPGAGASALEHLLGDHATIPTDRGLFLATTWRLHPAVCDFVSDAFYEGRLEPDPACQFQRLDEGSWAGGAGVRWRPVHHEGNRTSSAEEVSEVVAGVEALLGRQWTDRDGRSQRVGLGDILVVSPYNAQVARLRTALPPGARVGTVDRFQGQEAAVVIFSMATSSTADLPRSVEFLYSLNRLNVAVSRARALVVLVCCPDLLRVRCRTPREMRLANALCRLAELAGDTDDTAGNTDDTGGGREQLAS